MADAGPYDVLVIEFDDVHMVRRVVGVPPVDVTWSPELVEMLRAGLCEWADIRLDPNLDRGNHIIDLNVAPEPLSYRFTGERDGVDYVSERIDTEGDRWPS